MVEYKVVKIYDNNCKLVLNAGSKKEVHNGDRFLIFSLSDHEIIDPDTKESLGYLEIVKGIGKVIHVQEHLCTIESDKFENSSPAKIIRKKNSMYAPWESTEEEIPSPRKRVPFQSPQVGDYARLI